MHGKEVTATLNAQAVRCPDLAYVHTRGTYAHANASACTGCMTFTAEQTLHT